MKRFVLHTGISKTGTATLQQTVFAAHPQIYYLGKSSNNGVSRGCRSEEVYALLQPVLWDGAENVDWPQLAAGFQSRVMGAVGADQVAVGSWEGLGSMRTENFRQLLARLQRLDPAAGMLISLRNPLSWVGSQYLQEVQGQFVKNNRDMKFRRRPWLDFDGWMRSNLLLAGGLDGMFGYGDNVRAAVEMLGRERVGVFLFEELASAPDDYYRGIAAFLGIDAAECTRLAAGAHRNLRLTAAAMEHIREVDRGFVRRWRWRRQDSAQRRRELRQAEEAAGDTAGAKVLLSDRWKEAISATTSAGNRWLRDELGLPLEHYGYPL